MGDAVFDESHDAVLELVLASDDEYAGPEPAEADARREERRERLLEIAARFLPGVDAGALFALAAALVGWASASVMEILAQNQEISATIAQRPQTDSDPLKPFRDMSHFRFLGQGLFAAVAVVVALAVLTRWQADRHARWSRPAGQAALLLGAAGVVIALLGYFDVIGSLPTPIGSSGRFYTQR